MCCRFKCPDLNTCNLFFILNQEQYFPDGSNPNGECDNPDGCSDYESDNQCLICGVDLHTADCKCKNIKREVLVSKCSRPI